MTFYTENYNSVHLWWNLKQPTVLLRGTFRTEIVFDEIVTMSDDDPVHIMVNDHWRLYPEVALSQTKEDSMNYRNNRNHVEWHLSGGGTMSPWVSLIISLVGWKIERKLIAGFAHYCWIEMRFYRLKLSTNSTCFLIHTSFCFSEN